MVADDIDPANGFDVMDFGQAQAAAGGPSRSGTPSRSPTPSPIT